MGKKKCIAIDSEFVVKQRNAQGLNQSEFWRPLGVTQSGGSRYESGRRIPAPTRKLIYLMHVQGLNAYQLEAIGKV